MNRVELCACLFKSSSDGGVHGDGSHNRLLDKEATGGQLSEHRRNCNSFGRTLSSDTQSLKYSKSITLFYINMS